MNRQPSRHRGDALLALVLNSREDLRDARARWDSIQEDHDVCGAAHTMRRLRDLGLSNEDIQTVLDVLASEAV